MIITFITDIETIGDTVTVPVKAFIDQSVTVVVHTVTHLLVGLGDGDATS